MNGTKMRSTFALSATVFFLVAVVAVVVAQPVQATMTIGNTVTYQHVLYSFDKNSTIRVKVGAESEQPDGANLSPKTDQAGDLEGNEPRLSTLAWLGGWSEWGKCTGAWCVGAAGGCAVGAAISAEVGWLPCTAIGCIAGACRMHLRNSVEMRD